MFNSMNFQGAVKNGDFRAFYGLIADGCTPEP